MASKLNKFIKYIFLNFHTNKYFFKVSLYVLISKPCLTFNIIWKPKMFWHVLPQWIPFQFLSILMQSNTKNLWALVSSLWFIFFEFFGQFKWEQKLWNRFKGGVFKGLVKPFIHYLFYRTTLFFAVLNESDYDNIQNVVINAVMLLDCLSCVNWWP